MDQLTQTELFMLEQLAAGDTWKDIASALGTTEQTLKNGARRLYDKLGADNACQAVAMAMRRGIIK